MKVKIKNITNEYKGFFTLEKAKLQFEKFDGSASEEVIRENFYRGDSVAVLIYDTKNQLVMLERQFRYPVYAVEPEDGWIDELVAGSVKDGEDPVDTLLRELEEEVHISASRKKLQYISTFYVSPGGTSERIHLYALDKVLKNYRFKRGGLADEVEDIEIFILPFSEVFKRMENGLIKDAKTIIAVQWLKKKIM